MSLISKAIPNFFGGVSQQSAASRHVTQCESLVNGDPSIANGLGKRVPTEHLAKLASAQPDNAFVHFIIRSATQQHMLVITNGALAIYDLAGVAQTISSPDGVGYLTSSNPREDFAAVTVADYTFIVNKAVTVAMDSATGAGSVTGTVQQFSELPTPIPASGTIYKIEGTPTTNFDNYYVQSNGSVWVETVLPGIQNTFDAATMPFKLTKTGASTFTFEENTWTDRLVGDTDSNPVPSFVGRTISDVFFHRNRLGFVSDEQVILTRSGDPFNFWAETVTASLDSDPIDAGVSTNTVAILNHAVPFNKSLMLFSTGGQFQLSGGDTLTPKTAKLDPTTEFESSPLARPASAGNSLFFSVPKQRSTGFREYFVDQDTISNDAADIAAHVPNYIPAGVFKLISSTTLDLMLSLNTTERDTIYVYKYYWSGDEKVQSAWHKWTFGEGAVILGAGFVNSMLYLLVNRDGETFLERMVLDWNDKTSTLPFKVLLDRQVELTGIYDAINDWTTWTLPYSKADGVTVVFGDAFGANSGNTPSVTTRPSATTLRAIGDWTAGPCHVGCDYEMRERMSTIYLRDEKSVAVLGGTLTLQNLRVWLNDTGYLRAEVSLPGRSLSSYEFTGKKIGTYILGQLSVTDAAFTFPIDGLNTEVTIDLINDTYLPCNLIMAEWDGNYVNHKART